MTPTAHRHASAITLRGCPDCGLVQTIPVMPKKTSCSCLRCGRSLRHTRSRTSLVVLALALTSFVLYFIAVGSPFLSVQIVGLRRDTTMGSLPIAFVENGMWEVGVVVLLTSIVMPFCKVSVVLLTLLGLRTTNPPRWLPFLFRQYNHIGPWAMVEVFLLGVFVAFTRLQAIATVEVGIGLYALAGLMLTMVLTDYLLDREVVWQEMAAHGLVQGGNAGGALRNPVICLNCNLLNDAQPGDPCLRCGTTLHVRKPDSIARTWALLATAVLMYVPANIYPILTLVRLGSGAPSTILGGARELLDAGMWPLALLVLVASVMVPLFKLVGLVFMLVEIHRGSSWRLRDRTRLYRVIDFIGRWSMIDVFMLSTLIGLVRDGRIATVTPGFGAVCFAGVVIVTMFAAASFDPRLMWDAAERRIARGAASGTSGSRFPAAPQTRPA